MISKMKTICFFVDSDPCQGIQDRVHHKNQNKGYRSEEEIGYGTFHAVKVTTTTNIEHPDSMWRKGSKYMLHMFTY